MKPVFLPHFSVVFEERYILLTDQISLPNCLYFLRYWGIYELYLFVPTNKCHDITFWS